MNFKAFYSFEILLAFLLVIPLIFLINSPSEFQESLLDFQLRQKQHDLIKIWVYDFDSLSFGEMKSDLLRVFPEKKLFLQFNNQKEFFGEANDFEYSINSQTSFYGSSLNENIISVKVFLE